MVKSIAVNEEDKENQTRSIPLHPFQPPPPSLHLTPPASRSIIPTPFTLPDASVLPHPGIRRPPGSVGVPGIRGRLSVDADVHDSSELRQRLGVGISAPDGHLDALLDRVSPKRTSSVAGQGPQPNGISHDDVFLDVMTAAVILIADRNGGEKHTNAKTQVISCAHNF